MKVYKLGLIIFIITTFIGSGSSLFSSPQAKSSVKKTKGIQKTSKSLPRPDLIVENIWLDKNCRIIFSLKNVGKGKISAKLHHLGKVSLWIGPKRHIFNFRDRIFIKSVDPKGLLKIPGRLVKFNTKIKLKTRATVTVFVDSSKKIPEGKGETNNRKSRSLKPKCKPTIAPASTTVRGTTPKPPPSSQVRYPSPTAKINSFHMRRGSTSTTNMMSRGTSTGRSSYTVNYLDDIRFSYHVTGCQASEVTTTIDQFLPGASNRFSHWNTTDDQRNEGNCYSIVGRTSTHEVRATMDYVLTVVAKGTNPMLRKKVTKKIRVNVRRPQLVLERPVIRDTGGQFKVDLYVKNTGRIDYPSPGARIMGRFRVLNNHNNSIVYADERFDEGRFDFKAGDRHKVATFTVEPRHHLTAARKIIIKAEADDGRDLFTSSGKSVSYLHSFNEQTLEINTDILFTLLSTMMSGNIRLNNYNAPSGNTTSTRPGVSNDCRVVLGSEDTTFTIPFWSLKVKGKVTGKTYIAYRPFFNDINADVGDTGDFSVPRKNVVKLRVDFETGGGNEIKGYEYEDGVYNDSALPDINLQQLSLEMTFLLNVVHGKLKITDFYMTPTVRMEISGRYENILNMFKGKMNQYLESNLAPTIESMLGLNSFITRLNNEIGTALGLMGVYTISKVELTSDKLKITYFR